MQNSKTYILSNVILLYLVMACAKRYQILFILPYAFEMLV